MGQGTVGAALVMNINSVALNFSGNYSLSNRIIINIKYKLLHNIHSPSDYENYHNSLKVCNFLLLFFELENIFRYLMSFFASANFLLLLIIYLCAQKLLDVITS